MKSSRVGVLAVALLLFATPLSLQRSNGIEPSLSIVFGSAKAAELIVPVRHHRITSRSSGYYSRLYDPWCNGPYTGGGWNGGTYFGGPWIDLRCYGGVY